MPQTTNPVNCGWSACDGGGIIPIMYTQESAPVELRELTHLYCTEEDCTDEKIGCIGLH